MSHWFRFYDEVLDDPKVQTLPPELFKIWVNHLCLLSRNNGKLPSIEACSFALRETETTVSSAFHQLTKAGLLETDGETFHSRTFKKRQYKSDTSTDRVRKFRQKSKRFGNVSETPPDTETEKEIKKFYKKSYPQEHVLETGLASPQQPPSDAEAFEIFRLGYPALKRGGKPASGLRAWNAALSRGSTADEIIAGLEAIKNSEQEKFLPGWVQFLDNDMWRETASKSNAEKNKSPKQKCERCGTVDASAWVGRLCMACYQHCLKTPSTKTSELQHLAQKMSNHKNPAKNGSDLKTNEPPKAVEIKSYGANPGLANGLTKSSTDIAGNEKVA